MYAMKDTSMAGCANTAFQLVAACGALQTLASVNSEHTGHLAKAVEMICTDCQKECEKWPKVAECKTCGESCKACAAQRRAAHGMCRPPFTAAVVFCRLLRATNSFDDAQ